MRNNLESLAAELKIWREERRSLPIWWRDDDATAPSPALDRLVLLAQKVGAPLHLAVIPAHAVAELAERLRQAPGARVLQHGWAHLNHAPANEKKAEFGAHRPYQTMLDEITRGRDRIDELFGSQTLPIFTPPWNRISPSLMEELPKTGIRALSRYLSRKSQYAAPGLIEVNTHIDPIDWHGGRGLLDPPKLVSGLCGHLEARRRGMADPSEPLGLLTHHLVHDEEVWSFTEHLLCALVESEATAWTSPLSEADG